MADDAGALLVRSGLIRSDDLAAARLACADVGGTIGEHLVAAGLVADELLTEFYRSRLLVPQVNPNNLARLAAPVVATIPGDMAVELRVVPVAVDREGNLTVAMSDPSDRHAVDEISFFTGHYVVRAVATQMQIAWCLAHYYGHVTELGRRLLRPSREPAASPSPDAPRDGNGAESSPTRSRGITGRIEAMRHKVLPPTTQPPADSDVATTAVGRPAIAVETPAGAPVAIAAPESEPLAALGPVSSTLVGVAPAPALRALTQERASRHDEHGDTRADSYDRSRGDDDDDLVDEDPPGDDDGRDDDGRDDDEDGDDEDGDDSNGDLAGEVPESVGRDPESEDDDEPEIQIRDASGPVRIGLGDTRPTGRFGPRVPDPPELAARAGEVEVRAGYEPRNLDLPAVVIAELSTPPTAAPPVVLIEAGGETSQIAPLARPGSDADPHFLDEDRVDDRDPSLISSEVPAMVVDAESAPILLLTPRRAATAPSRDHDDDEVTAPGDDPNGQPRGLRADRNGDLPYGDDAFDDLDGDRDRRNGDDRDDDYDDSDNDDEYDDSDDDLAPVVLLDRKKPETPPSGRRPERHTQVGIGEVGSLRRRRGQRPDQGVTLPMIDVLLTAPPEIPTDVDTTVRVPVDVAPAQTSSAPELVRRAPWTAGDARPAPLSSPRAAATEPVRVGVSNGSEPTSGRVASAVLGSSSDNVADGVPRVITEDEDGNTRRVDTRRNRRSSMSMAEVDDGWGPPGTTIPPPYLGAVLADESPAARIPIVEDDLSGPLLVAPPSPPEERTSTAASSATPTAAAAVVTASMSRPHPAELARDLEAASTRLVDLVRGLDRAESRDEVIGLLVGLIADSHTHAAFFAVRGGELHPFVTRPPGPGAASATLRLETASTFQDVVGTRLPYRGPLVDDASRALVLNTFGTEADEVLVIPVAVRDRVVGVLYGAGRVRHTFDEHVGLAARAAGLALERILKARRPTVS